MSSKNTNNRTHINDNEDKSSIDSRFNQIESEKDEFNDFDSLDLNDDYDQNEKEEEENPKEELSKKQIIKIESISFNIKEKIQDKNINKNEEINPSLNSSIKLLRKKRNNSNHH